MSSISWTKWGRPDTTITRTRPDRPACGWIARARPTDTRPSWATSGSGPDGGSSARDLVVGPAVLWDDPEFEPITTSVPWRELEPVAIPGGLTFQPARRRAISRAGKRLFDILFSIVALALTVPLYPFIAFAIVFEDGWPVFFTHKRETFGGTEFPCLKFRSMRRDAEKIKADIQKENVSDGPQFFMEEDPRATQVGRFLRKTQLDEIPQFWNVLAGHMSVVGPRPSPRKENQFCPPWREARLSVRPGVTGLWQSRFAPAPRAWTSRSGFATTWNTLNA